jgi:phenylacetate-coenzyme A ligase PaaK-like adenylate-forming protein
MAILQHLHFAWTLLRVERIPPWPPSRLDRLQDRRLRRLLAHAAARSPFYRSKYRNIDLARVPLEELPPVGKDDIREHFDEVVTDRRLRRDDLERYIADEDNLGRLYLGEFAVCRTSGSQGAPILIVQHRSCLELITALMATRSSPDDRHSVFEAIPLLIHPKRVATIAFKRGFYPSGMVLEFLPQSIGPFARVSCFSSMDPRLVEHLNDLQPHIITGYASVLDALAFQAHRLRLSSLEFIRNSSEQLSRSARARIERAFGVKVFDHYGTGECLQLADSCRDCGLMHVNADWAILEIVDEQGDPVPAGTAGAKVLITNLANWTQPFIRYEVGDRVALAAEPCRTNRFPRIDRIEGRSTDVFWVGGRRDRFISWVLFQTVVEDFPVIREWRAIQRERNSVELQVQLVPGEHPPPDRISAELVAKLVESGLPACVGVTVTFVDEVAADARTGKIRRMISDLGPAFVRH